MTSKNGHVETLGTPVTLEKLRQAARKKLTARHLSDEAGEPVVFLCRRLWRHEYNAFLPPPPPGSEQWASDETDASKRDEAYAARERDWLAGLTPEERAARRVAWVTFAANICAAAILEPKLTLADAMELGDDCDALAGDILRHSRILPPLPETPAPDETPAPEPASA